MGKTAFITTNGFTTCCNYNLNTFYKDLVGENRAASSAGIICPHCNHGMIYYLSRSGRNPVAVTNYKNNVLVKKFKPCIDRSTKSSYYFEAGAGHIYRKENLQADIYNYKTGMLYLLLKNSFPKKVKMVRTFNNVFLLDNNSSLKFAAKCLEYRTKELLPDIDVTKVLCERFGIVDTGRAEDFVKALIDKSHTWIVTHSNMFFAIMKDPKMAMLPYTAYGSSVPSKLKKKWASVNTRTEAFKTVFGFGKAFRKFIAEHELDGVNTPGFSRRAEFVPNFYIMSKLFRHDLLFDLFEDLGWDAGIVQESDMTTERKLFDHYKTNKLLAIDRAFVEQVGERRLLNHIKDWYVNPYYTVGKGENKKRIKKSLNPMAALSMLSDTLKCWRTIYEKAPNFTIRRQNSLKALHDYISKEQRKIGVANVVIPYTDSEKTLNCTLGEYTFVLAKDTHDLLDVGNDLSMCVGGYGDGALKKHYVIVNVYCGGIVKVCIEMRKQDNQWRMIQAKMFGNARIADDPGAYQAAKMFCLNNNVVFDECYDMANDPDTFYARRRDMYNNHQEMLDDNVVELPRLRIAAIVDDIAEQNDFLNGF